jgi:hypothetical protein
MNDIVNEVKLPQPSLATDVEQFWQDHVQKQQVSGLNMAAYCRANGLTPHLFYYQSQKRRDKPLGLDSQSNTFFHPVTLATSESKIKLTDLNVVFRLPNGIECELQRANVGVCLEVLGSLARLPL